MDTARTSSKGQIVIPKEIRDRVELKSHHPMSYADCFAAAAAIKEGATLLTSDPEFQSVKHLVNVESI